MNDRRITEPSEIHFLKTIRPKKSLGQNFLIDNNILNKIISESSVTKKDTILEIGAGSGALTFKLADKAKYVFALEIDFKLCDLLEQRIAGRRNIKLIKKDILKFSFSSLKPIPKKGIKVIANIPYYISTPIIGHLLKNRKNIDGIFLTIQKELADRMIAQPGSKDYSSLSCFVQFYTEPKKLFIIKKNSFLPPPKVGSCFLSLKILKKVRFKVKDEKLLFKIIRTAFQMRRKTILNSLSSIMPKEKLKEVFLRLKIDPTLRAENLTLKDFVTIANSIG